MAEYNLLQKKILADGTIKSGDVLKVEIYQNNTLVYKGNIPFANTFGDVPERKPLAYFNSLMDLSFALNMDSFAAVHKIGSGPEWSVKVEKITR